MFYIHCYLVEKKIVTSIYIYTESRGFTYMKYKFVEVGVLVENEE